MKITKRQLKRIIKEEKQSILQELGVRGTQGASPLLDFALEYSKLGEAIQEQVEELVSAYTNFTPNSKEFEDAVHNVNPNAIQVAITKLTQTGHLVGDEADDIFNALELALEVYEEADRD